MNDSMETQRMELACKHTNVQEVMVTDMYLSKRDGTPRVRGIDNCKAAAERRN